MTAPDYAARVTAGAAFLDGQLPGWAGRINLDTLRLEDACHCVLGQLGENYQDTRDDLHLSQGDAMRLGFTLSGGEPWKGWAELDAAWAAEITRRREAGQVTT